MDGGVYSPVYLLNRPVGQRRRHLLLHCTPRLTLTDMAFGRDNGFAPGPDNCGEGRPGDSGTWVGMGFPCSLPWSVTRRVSRVSLSAVDATQRQMTTIVNEETAGQTGRNGKDVQ